MKQGIISKAWFLLPVLLLAACTGKVKDAEEGGVETLPPAANAEVSVMVLHRSDFHHQLVSNGKLAAASAAGLYFESAEPIAQIWVKDGDRVRAGQKLAALSTFKLHNATEQAKAALDQARLNVQDALIGQGYPLADSAKVPPAVRQLARTRNGYDQLLAAYELARYEEEHAVLTAPFDGVVANLFTKPFDQASTSQPFCTVLDSRQLEVDFTVLESELPLLKTGDDVSVTPFFSGDSTVLRGRVTEINPQVGDDGMVKVRALVSNEGGRLFDGMNVRVSVLRSVPGQFVVPKSAVVLRSNKQVVFTVKNGKAYWNYVHTGLENAQSYTIADGLQDGDTVIISGNLNLAHESPITVKN